MTFTEYCAKNNIKLQEADLTFIKKQLKTVADGDRKAVVKRYCDIWIKARDSEPRVPAKQNRGRYAANTWLRTRT